MEIMKKLQLLLVSVAMLSIFSCSDDDDDTLGVWYRRSDFDGRAREDAAGFVIGNRGYLCGGYRKKTVGNTILIMTGGHNAKICPTMQQPGMALPDSQ
jgi:hypothetical protein